jgi:RES domain-containing protein
MALDGEGARKYGGRWNPPGVRAVYLADSRTLAALEIIVHAPREVLPLEWRLMSVEIPAEVPPSRKP